MRGDGPRRRLEKARERRRVACTVYYCNSAAGSAFTTPPAAFLGACRNHARRLLGLSGHPIGVQDEFGWRLSGRLSCPGRLSLPEEDPSAEGTGKGNGRA